jgi:hypothetical protein
MAFVMWMMFHGELRELQDMGGNLNTSKVKSISSLHGNYFHYFRLFWNAILAFVFLYIDIVVPQRGDSDGGKVLLGIGIYSTAIILIKTILAVYNHFKWIFCEKCCTTI